MSQPGGDVISWERCSVLPGLGIFGERCQTAGVHVSANVNVDRGVGLGELGGGWDTLGGHGRHR